MRRRTVRWRASASIVSGLALTATAFPFVASTAAPAGPEEPADLWTPVSAQRADSVPAGAKRRVEPKEYTAYTVDDAVLDDVLSDAPREDSDARGALLSLPAPSGELPAQNFLLVGSDSRDCISPEQADAAAFLGEPVVGGRSDTIMVLRVERNAESASILSFPRDLWVRISGSNRKSRINNAFDKDDPSRLVRTIEDNFDVPIDHYVDVDFCAFKRMMSNWMRVSVSHCSLLSSNFCPLQ